MPIPKKLPSRGEGATASAKATSGKQIAEPKSQAIVGKRYNIVSHLGSGNFGTVFLVTDTKSHDRLVDRGGGSVLEVFILGDLFSG